MPPKTSLWRVNILFFQLTTNSQIYFTSGSSRWLRRNKLLQKLKKISEITVKTIARKMKTLGTLLTVQALEVLQTRRIQQVAALYVWCSCQAVNTRKWPGYQVHNQQEATERDSECNWKKRRHRGESTAHLKMLTSLKS